MQRLLSCTAHFRDPFLDTLRLARVDVHATGDVKWSESMWMVDFRCALLTEVEIAAVAERAVVTLSGKDIVATFIAREQIGRRFRVVQMIQDHHRAMFCTTELIELVPI